MADEDIRRYSRQELKAMRERGETRTRSDARETAPDEAFWRNARVTVPPGKKSIHLRVDADVLEWFRSQGRGYLTRMNAVLRST